MPAYLSQHISRIDKQYVISKTKIEKGMIVRCFYRKRPDKKGIVKTNEYIFLVLDPSYEGKMHCLSLTHISPQALNSFARDVGVIVEENRPRRIDIQHLELGINPKRLYENAIKKHLGGGKFDEAYRTIFSKSIVSVRVINYKFNKDVTII